jgi:HEPN domain-containing protein
MNEKTIQYWIDISEYDIVTAEVMLNTGRLLYVGFMCHQAIEKILKAYYIKALGETPPYTHNLLTLARRSNLFDQFSESQVEFINELVPLNVDSRYPEYKEKIWKTLTTEKCKTVLNKSNELLLWIKRKL